MKPVSKQSKTEEKKKTPEKLPESDPVMVSRPSTPSSDEKSVMKGALARALGGRSLRPLKTTLVQTLKVTGAANTAYTSVTPLQLSNGSDYSTFASIYDEVKADGFRIKYLDGFFLGTDPAAAVPPKLIVWAYDPVNSGVYGSAAAASEAEQHRNAFVTSGFSNYPSPGTDKSYPAGRMWRIRIKKGAQTNPSISNEVATGLWHATTDSNAIDGYLKPYIEALGTGYIYTCTMVIYMDVTYRSRT